MNNKIPRGKPLGISFSRGIGLGVNTITFLRCVFFNRCKQRGINPIATNKHSGIYSFLLLFLILLPFFGCATTVKNENDRPLVLSPNDLVFPIGQAVDNPALFNGTVYLSPLVRNDDIFNTPGMAYVVFPPGIINKWHVHGGGQILIATDGIGYHQIEGQSIEVLYPGDVTQCPPGVMHWHGAAPHTWFAHIAISTNPDMSSLEIFDFIPEAEYETLPREKTN